MHARKDILIALILLLLVSLPLVLWPQLDLSVSSWFALPEGGGFQPKTEGFAGFIYIAARVVQATLIIFVLLAWVVSEYRRLPVGGIARRSAIFLLLVAILGPGLLVHNGLKDNWGRARPSQIVEFGGDKTFSRAWVITDQCEKNCSFSSGHAAAGFYPLAFAFVYPKRRKTILVAGTAWGLLCGWARIVQGGHFLSDVLVSGALVYLVAALLHALIYRNTTEGSNNTAATPGNIGL